MGSEIDIPKREYDHQAYGRTTQAPPRGGKSGEMNRASILSTKYKGAMLCGFNCQKNPRLYARPVLHALVVKSL
jgi:hypothetical protein